MRVRTYTEVGPAASLHSLHYLPGLPIWGVCVWGADKCYWDPSVFPNSSCKADLPNLLQVRKWRSERASDLPAVTQLVRAVSGIWTQVGLIWRPLYHFHTCLSWANSFTAVDLAKCLAQRIYMSLFPCLLSYFKTAQKFTFCPTAPEKLLNPSEVWLVWEGKSSVPQARF